MSQLSSFFVNLIFPSFLSSAIVGTGLKVGAEAVEAGEVAMTEVSTGQVIFSHRYS